MPHGGSHPGQTRRGTDIETVLQDPNFLTTDISVGEFIRQFNELRAILLANPNIIDPSAVEELTRNIDTIIRDALRGMGGRPGVEKRSIFGVIPLPSGAIRTPTAEDLGIDPDTVKLSDIAALDSISMIRDLGIDSADIPFWSDIVAPIAFARQAGLLGLDPESSEFRKALDKSLERGRQFRAETLGSIQEEVTLQDEISDFDFTKPADLLEARKRSKAGRDLISQAAFNNLIAGMAQTNPQVLFDAGRQNLIDRRDLNRILLDLDLTSTSIKEDLENRKLLGDPRNQALIDRETFDVIRQRQRITARVRGIIESEEASRRRSGVQEAASQQELSNILSAIESGAPTAGIALPGEAGGGSLRDEEPTVTPPFTGSEEVIQDFLETLPEGNLKSFVESRLGAVLQQGGEQLSAARAAWFRVITGNVVKSDLQKQREALQLQLDQARAAVSRAQGQLQPPTQAGAEEPSQLQLDQAIELQQSFEEQLAGLPSVGPAQFADVPTAPREDPLKSFLTDFPFLQQFQALSPARRGFQQTRFAPPTRFVK